MTLKDAIDKYVDLVDNIIIQYYDGEEFEVSSEDAEFLEEDLIELEVSKVTRYLSSNECVIYLY